MLDIRENISLKELNTFHIHQKAKYFVEINSISDIKEVLESDIFKQNKCFILWWWANILFKSDFDGLVIKINILSREILSETPDSIVVKVWAWEDWHNFVMRCISNKYAGLENLVYIPWTVWASPIQNIWAYGAEVCQCIEQVFWVNLLTKQEAVLTNSECKFSYRNSIFKNEFKNSFIVTHVSFKLQKYNKNYKLNLNYKDVLQKIQDLSLKAEELSIKELADIIIDIRKNKLPDPNVIGTAWSFFQNPIVSKQHYENLKQTYPNLVWFELDQDNIKLSAGQLIELCGFKWYREWDAGVFSNHALVLVNYANAKWEDLISLANKIQSGVQKAFNVKILPEVNYI